MPFESSFFFITLSGWDLDVPEHAFSLLVGMGEGRMGVLNDMKLLVVFA